MIVIFEELYLWIRFTRFTEEGNTLNVVLFPVNLKAVISQSKLSIYSCIYTVQYLDEKINVQQQYHP